jgi:hypothetical protein
VIAYYEEKATMIAKDGFDTLYRQLVVSWDSPERLRETHPPASRLSGTSARLYQGRPVMWDWRRAYNSEIA